VYINAKDSDPVQNNKQSSPKGCTKVRGTASQPASAARSHHRRAAAPPVFNNDYRIRQG